MTGRTGGAAKTESKSDGQGNFLILKKQLLMTHVCMSVVHFNVDAKPLTSIKNDRKNHGSIIRDSASNTASNQIEDENRPSTYYSVANSGARHCPLTFSSKTLIGNWQENRYLEELPRNKASPIPFNLLSIKYCLLRSSQVRNTLLMKRRQTITEKV